MAKLGLCVKVEITPSFNPAWSGTGCRTVNVRVYRLGFHILRMKKINPTIAMEDFRNTVKEAVALSLKEIIKYFCSRFIGFQTGSK
jgi:hypothetical protein